MEDNALENISEGITLLRQGMSLMKEIKWFIPSKSKKAILRKNLEKAERELKIGEAKLAQGFGYPLCRCVFPPPIMLLDGDDNFIFKCPLCDRKTDTKPASVGSDPKRPGPFRSR